MVSFLKMLTPGFLVSTLGNSHWVWKMMFLFNWVIFRLRPLIFAGCFLLRITRPQKTNSKSPWNWARTHCNYWFWGRLLVSGRQENNRFTPAKKNGAVRSSGKKNPEFLSNQNLQFFPVKTCTVVVSIKMHGFLCHIYTWVGFPFPNTKI